MRTTDLTVSLPHTQDLRRVAIEELKKVENALDKESKDDAELREKYGSRWNRPASAALNSSMREKIAGYNSNLIAAGDSDARLEQRLMKDNAAFSALSIDAAVAQMPRLQVNDQDRNASTEVWLLWLKSSMFIRCVSCLSESMCCSLAE